MKFVVLAMADGSRRSLRVDARTSYSRLCGEGGRGGEWDMEVGEEGDYIPVATLSPPE